MWIQSRLAAEQSLKDFCRLTRFTAHSLSYSLSPFSSFLFICFLVFLPLSMATRIGFLDLPRDMLAELVRFTDPPSALCLALSSKSLFDQLSPFDSIMLHGKKFLY